MKDHNWFLDKKSQNNNQGRLFVIDLWGAIIGWKFWLYLAWMDVRGQYRRSFIGPVWLTMNTAIFISAFAFLGARIFNTSVESYLAPFACGQILFVFLSNTINESTYAFINSAAYVKQLPVPRLSFVLRVVVKNIIIFVHSIPVLIVVLLFWGEFNRVNVADLFLGVGAVFVFLVISCGVLGLIAARFRDVPMIVSNFVNLCYFVTPIIWSADILRNSERFFLYFNPFYLMIDLIRSPLIGRAVDKNVWHWFILMTLFVGLIGVPLAVKFRRSIPYWV